MDNFKFKVSLRYIMASCFKGPEAGYVWCLILVILASRRLSQEYVFRVQASITAD